MIPQGRQPPDVQLHSVAGRSGTVHRCGLGRQMPPSKSALKTSGTCNWHVTAVLTDEASEAAAGGEQSLRRSPKLARLEAALFAADAPMNTRRLAQVASLADGTEARTLIKRLNALYDATHTAFRVEQVAGGYQLYTRPEFSRWLARRHRRHSELQLSGPALETLTIVAYRQPILRAEVEAIRGVQCGEMLRQLLDKGVVRWVGRSNALGRPYLYGTTRKFLQLFGLRSLEDLPLAERLRMPAADAMQQQQAVPAGVAQPEAAQHAPAQANQGHGNEHGATK